MTTSIRKVLLRGVGFAAASGAFLSAPAFAGTPAETASANKPADAPADLIINAQNAPETQVAQTYVAPATSEVVELIQPETGWYIGVGAGAAWPIDQTWDANNLGDEDFNFDGDVKFGGGFSGEFAVGYDFGAIRTELSYVYTRSSVNEVSVNNIGDFDCNDCNFGATGNVNKHDIFLSAYWDIIPNSRWTPYIGGGVGYTNLSTPRITVGDVIRSDSESHGLFGWQGKLGLSYAASYNWDIYVEGTYSGASSFDSDYVSFGSYNDFGAKAGFRYRFGTPVVVVPPAPAPEPAPEPAPMPMPEPEPAPIRGLW